MNLFKRVSKGLLLTGTIYFLATASVSAKEYHLALTGPGGGDYTFGFANSGAGCGSPSALPLIPITGPTSGSVTLNQNLSFCVRVAAVNFDDGKTPPNQITGDYVRGVEGEITNNTNASEGVVMTFAWSGGNNPAGDVGTYTVVDDGVAGVTDDGQLVGTGTYVVYSVPEPGTLAMFALGGAALLWSRRKR